MDFSEFGLADQIIQGVRGEGYSTPTPIQSIAIPPALLGRDIVASAPTGTGKTAAFVLPFLHRLASEDVPQAGSKKPRALVLTPTRELAHQVQDAVISYGRYVALRSLAVYGGVGMDAQINQLRQGTDIVVATPGRLLDHLQRRTIDLHQIKVLVIDEADRMLDMGFIHDVRRIIDRIPRERQTLLFSATLSPEIVSLAGSILRNPLTVEEGVRRSPAEGIRHQFYEGEQGARTEFLIHALNTEAMESVLVFARTKHGADKINRHLERSGIGSAAIHSNRSQAQRERALAGFKEGRYRVLVATDIAARGIDIDSISHVVNLDIPRTPEDYIHRVGRTGRAGAPGDAITFLTREELPYLRRIERFTGKQFPVKQFRGPALRSGVALRPQSPKVERLTGGGPRRQDRVKHAKGHLYTSNVRKRKPIKKMESYSTSPASGGWSNY